MVYSRVWVDWLHPMAQDYWMAELMRFYDLVPFDALWVDLNEISSGCSFSCGNVLLNDSQLVPRTKISIASSQDPRNLDFPPYKINKYVFKKPW